MTQSGRTFAPTTSAVKTTRQYVDQRKRAEANLLGVRTHPKQPYAEHKFLLEQDLLGFGLNNQCTRDGTMIEFLQVLMCQPRDFALMPYLQEPQVRLSSEFYPAFIRTKHVLLRALIFNNNMAGPISQRNDLTDESKWDQWREHFVSANDWIKDAEGNATLDLSYLKRNFKDFATFATALRLLQNWAMDSEEGAAWTEHFLIPCGPYTCFWQLNQDLKPISLDLSGAGQILYFALMRAPTKASLMQFQAWAHHAHERSLYPELGLKVKSPNLGSQVLALTKQVGQELYQRFFDQPNIFNRCAQQVEGPYAQAELELCQYLAAHAGTLATNADHSDFNHFRVEQEALWPQGQIAVDKLNHLNSFPLQGHRIFIQLLGDYANILAQSLTSQDLFAALGTITLLNFMVLGLEQSQGAMALYDPNKAVDISMIPAVNTSPKDRMRKAALMRCKANYELHALMLKQYAYAHLRLFLEEVQPGFKGGVLTADKVNLILKAIFALFSFNQAGQTELLTYLADKLALLKGKNPVGTPQERIVALRVGYKDFVTVLLGYFQDQRAYDNNYHRVLGRQIGLITTELTTGHCYVLSDHLVTTLVMAVLGKNRHLPWQDFLQALAERYHIIIGVKQARANYAKGGRYYGSLRLGDLDEEFRKNERALRIKLERLGLLLVLSDGCDFVKNPFYAAGPNPQP